MTVLDTCTYRLHKEPNKSYRAENNTYEIKNSMNGVNRKVEIIEGKKKSVILKIEMEIIYSGEQREKQIIKKLRNLQESVG